MVPSAFNFIGSLVDLLYKPLFKILPLHKRIVVNIVLVFFKFSSCHGHDDTTAKSLSFGSS